MDPRERATNVWTASPGRYPGYEMAKSQPAKKPEPPKTPELRVLPMDLRLGDRLADERS